MLDILPMKLSKRGIDIVCVDTGEPQITGQAARQTVTLHQGIDKELAKKITKRIKNSKLKVQASIQVEKVRVTGKNRDDLQKLFRYVARRKFDKMRGKRNCFYNRCGGCLSN
ncbi:MAG: hypothetical protein AXA67_09135 [Methylothermaceae bacteria B42]|nr:MAG: hypothetical protein AXA67_09135 [Methylothermaceae bacteria B42]HHJ39466.1 DUF520 family protein [Methylothermaceae bacterium]